MDYTYRPISKFIAQKATENKVYLGIFSIFCYKGKGVSVTYCVIAADDNRETKKTSCRNKH